MIVTLTLNPSVDRTIEVSALVRGAVLRAHSVRVDPGGKGINVARALAANGHATRAVVPTGGPEGDHLVALLAAEGIDTVAVPIAAAIRSNVTVVEPDGVTTKLNEPGASFLASELENVVGALLGAAAGADWVVVSGSLPPGLSTRMYADIIMVLADSGIATAVDTSGEALAEVVRAKPVLVKPNHAELSAVSGRTIACVGDAVDAAYDLLDQGTQQVLASLGEDGALLVNGDGIWHAEAPAARPRSSVGAGDALLAGFLAHGADGPDALVGAVAWGCAAVGLPGSRMPVPSDIHLDAVTLHPYLDRDRALRREERVRHYSPPRHPD